HGGAHGDPWHGHAGKRYRQLRSFHRGRPRPLCQGDRSPRPQPQDTQVTAPNVGVPMRIFDVNQQPSEQRRTGVTTRMKVSAANRATQLCMFEQWCDPGHGAPNHLHAVEEVLCVREGQADVWIDEQHVTLTSGQLVIVPAGRKHGFSNTGETVLHIESTLAAPVFEAAYEDKRETPRRWLPGA